MGWRGEDSNLRRLTPADLQSAPFGHSGTSPLTGCGESPETALVREIDEETGLRPTVRSLIGVHDAHLTGNAPDGRREDFHAVNLVYEAEVSDAQEPVVREVDGTTDAVAWVALTDIASGVVPVTDLVRFALALD